MLVLPKESRTGVPSKYAAQLDHLQSLLKNLPESLPNSPPISTYQFGLDPDDITSELGSWYALNRNLEICFETYRGLEITISERGSRIQSVVQHIKGLLKMLSTSNRELTVEKWVEGLISAAVRVGAKIPTQR
jgi:hypothetical protein